MYIGLTNEICTKAWLLIQPAIYASFRPMNVTNKHDGCIVVLNPASADFEVLFTTTINGDATDGKYVEIAHSKASVTHRTKLPSSMVQTQYPYYVQGETKWGGSTIDAGNLVVAFSGVQAVFDEMISEWMGSAIRALCRHEMTREGGVMESKSSWIGE